MASVVQRCGRYSRAAAPTARWGAASGHAGDGAVVLLDSTEMLVVGDLLVLVHEEGTLMPQGGEENHFFG